MYACGTHFHVNMFGLCVCVCGACMRAVLTSMLTRLGCVCVCGACMRAVLTSMLTRSGCVCVCGACMRAVLHHTHTLPC